MSEQQQQSESNSFFREFVLLSIGELACIIRVNCWRLFSCSIYFLLYFLESPHPQPQPQPTAPPPQQHSQGQHPGGWAAQYAQEQAMQRRYEAAVAEATKTGKPIDPNARPYWMSR
jgi:hypothetical protein